MVYKCCKWQHLSLFSVNNESKLFIKQPKNNLICPSSHQLHIKPLHPPCADFLLTMMVRWVGLKLKLNVSSWCNNVPIDCCSYCENIFVNSFIITLFINFIIYFLYFKNEYFLSVIMVWTWLSMMKR